jgi:hypothetical protein
MYNTTKSCTKTTNIIPYHSLYCPAPSRRISSHPKKGLERTVREEERKEKREEVGGYRIKPY